MLVFPLPLTVKQPLTTKLERTHTHM